MAIPKQPSPAVLAARARRASTARDRQVRMEWFADNVIDTVQMTMKDRVTLATDFIRNKVVQNISKSVVVGKNKFGRRKVIERSKPGEYPRADTNALMKSIFT